MQMGFMRMKPACHTLSTMAIMTVLFVVHLSIAVEGGSMECEELAVEDCAFAVASSGARCVLEKHYHTQNAEMQYTCQTSIVMAEKGAIEWIETDTCIRACGVTRMWVGLSTDALLEGRFMQGLCSEPCRNQCPSIMDLFTKLAVEEGFYLPKLCDSLGATEMHQKQVTKTSTKFATSRRELRENKESMTLQSLQDMNGGFPTGPPFDARAPYPKEPWGVHAKPPYPFVFPHVEPPYPIGFPQVESPHPYEKVEPPYPFEAPIPYEQLEPPFPYEHMKPPSPYEHAEPPYPLEEPPYPYGHVESPHPIEEPPSIYGEPPYPQAPYVPPYFIEPPYYQEPSNNDYGEPPFPDFSSESPIYTQPEPVLVAPNLPPFYLTDGF